MVFGGLFGKKGSSRDAIAAGAMLDSCARVGLDKAEYPNLSEDYLQSLNLLLHLTKAAMITHWLRIMENNLPNSNRVTDVVAVFEHYTFFSVADTNRALAARHVENLVRATIHLEQLIGEDKLPEQERSRQMMQWCRKWLGLVDANENFVTQVTESYGMFLVLYLRESMQELGNKVAAVFGEGTK